jgi:hypothetical protein
MFIRFSMLTWICVCVCVNIEGKGKRVDVYLEVRKRRGHIFFEWNKCLWLITLYVDFGTKTKNNKVSFRILFKRSTCILLVHKIFLFSTATFKYIYRAPLKRIGQEKSASVAKWKFQSLKRIQPLPVRFKLIYKIKKKGALKIFLILITQALVSFKKIYAPSSSLLQGKYLPFSPSPPRLNIFRLFMILSLTQLYRYHEQRAECRVGPVRLALSILTKIVQILRSVWFLGHSLNILVQFVWGGPGRYI